MNLAFERFIELRIRHDYYRDGACPDMRVTPTPATLALLGARQLRLLPRADGFSLIGPVEVDGAGGQRPRFPLEPGERLVFALALASPDFVYFTDLPLEAGAGRRLLLRNREGTSRLTADAVVGARDQVRLTGPQLSVRVPRSATGSSVTVEDDAGRTLAVAQVAHFEEDALDVPISLGEFNGLAWVRGGGRTEPEPIFVSEELRGMGAFALLELRPLGESWPPQPTGKDQRTIVPLAFAADFRRRTTRWRYHVVAPRGWPDSDALSIGYPAHVPDAYPVGVTFPRATFPEIATLFPDKDVVSFESNQALPFHEEALRNARLETPQRTVLHHLPNAPRNALKRTDTPNSQLVSEIFVKL